MIDTSILFKVARVGLVDMTEPAEPAEPTEQSGAEQPTIVDFNRFDITGTGAEALTRTGILPVEDIRFFVDYCHYRGIEANLAGSVQSYQAQQIWRLVEKIDQLSTRGGASAVAVDPARRSTGEESVASRRDQVMKRELVAGLAPPEQGGYVWLPTKMKDVDGVDDAVHRLRKTFPDITTVYWADRFGNLEPYQAES